MPVVHMPIDNSTLVATSAVMSVITFGFCAAMGMKPGIALVIGAIVGIVLYALGIVPIGLLVAVGIAMIIGIFKAIFSGGKAPDE